MCLQNKCFLIMCQAYFIIDINWMKKLSINYNRVFPDHRVPIDYHFNKQLMQGPSTYFRLLKDGFNAGLTKNVIIHLPMFALVIFGVVGTVIYWDQDITTTEIKKRNIPVIKYITLTREGGYGAYDNILQRFEKEPGGIRDLPFNE